MGDKFSLARENFLQRRYGVRLGRRYALAAAGVVLVSVLGCSQINKELGTMDGSVHPLERISSLTPLEDEL
jgi:serpin B